MHTEIAWHYSTLHYNYDTITITLHYLTLHFITFHCLTFPLHYIDAKTTYIHTFHTYYPLLQCFYKVMNDIVDVWTLQPERSMLSFWANATTGKNTQNFFALNAIRNAFGLLPAQNTPINSKGWRIRSFSKDEFQHPMSIIVETEWIKSSPRPTFPLPMFLFCWPTLGPQPIMRLHGGMFCHTPVDGIRVIALLSAEPCASMSHNEACKVGPHQL